MKKIIGILITTFIICSLFQTTVYCQAPSLDWAKRMGNNRNEVAVDVVVGPLGNVFITGDFGGTVDFDPGSGTFNLTSKGGQDVFVVKLEASGQLAWAKAIGGKSNLSARGLALDNSGNVIVTGYYRDTVDFDPGSGVFNMSTDGSLNDFVFKLDNTGNFIWAKQFYGLKNSSPPDVVIDNANNVLLAGAYSEEVDFDPGPATHLLTAKSLAPSPDAYICKLDSNGIFNWVISLGSNGYDFSRAIDVNDNGDIVVLGQFNDTIDFDPGTGIFNMISSSNNIFIAKYNSNGGFIMAKKIGGPLSGLDSRDVRYDQSSNIYITGGFQGSADFDPGSGTYNLTPNGIRDIFLCKLNISGGFLWAKDIGGVDQDQGYNVITDKSNNVYVSGRFRDSVDFNPNSGTYFINSNGSSDVCIFSLDSNGTFIWAVGMGGPAFDVAYGLDFYRTGKIISTGFFNDTADFDPDTSSYVLSSSGFGDVFVVKLSQCSNSDSSIAAAACISYISPSGNFIWEETGLYFDTLVNSTGCDSIIRISLTVTKVNTIVSVSNSTLTANLGGATYQWINCDNGNSLINGAVNQSFKPSGNGRYAVIVSKNGCTDTSDCKSITWVGSDDIHLSNTVKAYPNPTKDVLHLLLNTDDFGIEVYNSQGQLVLSRQMESTKRINVSMLQSGIYFARIKFTDDRYAGFSFIKE